MEQELAQGFFKAILDKYTDPVLSKIEKKAKDGWEKFKIDFDFSFRNYIKKAYGKYSRVKTILYKAEPQFIYDFFEVPFLKSDYKKAFKADSIEAVISQANYIVIRGTGGIGKSTLLKHLFISAINYGELIPVFLELKDLNDYSGSYDLLDFIFERLDNLDCKINIEYLDYALRSGRFVFLLDGYDEMQTEKRNTFIKKLDAFCDRYSENYYIIASRPVSEFVELQRFAVLNTLPFKKEQAISLVEKLNYDADIKERFITALKEGLYKKHESFASNPLLLSIMLLTFENYAEIPEKLHLFYANAFETLYEKHDATKAGFKREIQSKLSFDDFKHVFAHFCFITYAQGKIEFSPDEIRAILRKIEGKRVHFDIDKYISDLSNALCVIYVDGLNYRFSHRSFQEYFTAYFLRELPDNNMSKSAIWLIAQDPSRAANDGVFTMLYDMADERFEQGILLTIICDCEEELKAAYGEEVSHNRLFDYYFESVVSAIYFDPTPKGDSLGLWVGLKDSFDYSPFIYSMSRIYVRKNKIKFDRRKEGEQQDRLFRFLCDNRSYEQGERIVVEDVMKDSEVYDIVKQTWIGQQINLICDMRKLITEKGEKNDKDLSDMLDELMSAEIVYN